MPLLPGNAPYAQNGFFDVREVRRELTAIDRNAAFWTAQCSDGSGRTNCIQTVVPAYSPKLDTCGYFAPFPTLLLELPSVVSPVHSNLVEATWASGVNDFGQVCGAIDKLSEGTSQTEQWQPCVWSSSPGSAGAAAQMLPVPTGELGGHVVAIDSAIGGVRRACGFVSEGPHVQGIPRACAWEETGGTGVNWCAYLLSDVTLPPAEAQSPLVLEIAYDRANTGQVVAAGGGRWYLLTHHCDLDSDLGVSAGDYSMLLSMWGTPNGDVDGDQATGARDLATLFSNWTSGAVALIPLHCSNITVTTEDLEALQLAHAAVGTSVEAMAAWHPDCEYEMLGYEITCEFVKCVYVLLKDARAGQGGNQ